MNCTQIQKRLAGYSAGLVQGDERVQVRDHIASCASCAVELGEYRAMDELISGGGAGADESLVQSVMAEVRVMPIRRRPAWLAALDGIGPLVGAAASLPAVGACVVTVVTATAASLEGAAVVEAAAGMAAALALAGMAAGAMAWVMEKTVRIALQ